MQRTFAAAQYSLNPRVLIFRGVLSIAFGVLALAWPGPGLLAITLIYGAYALSDGVFAIASGVRRERRGQSWGLPIAEGLLGVGAGVATLFWPGVTLLVLSVLVGAWAISTGVLEVATAFKLKRFVPVVSRSGRFLFGLVGVLSVLLGVAIFVFPPVGALTLLAIVASYALASGALMCGFGLLLRRSGKAVAETPLDLAA